MTWIGIILFCLLPLVSIVTLGVIAWRKMHPPKPPVGRERPMPFLLSRNTNPEQAQRVIKNVGTDRYRKLQ